MIEGMNLDWTSKTTFSKKTTIRVNIDMQVLQPRNDVCSNRLVMDSISFRFE